MTISTLHPVSRLHVTDLTTKIEELIGNPKKLAEEMLNASQEGKWSYLISSNDGYLSVESSDLDVRGHCDDCASTCECEDDACSIVNSDQSTILLTLSPEGEIVK